eukprot:6487897-Prymnesium_polylepis.2
MQANATARKLPPPIDGLSSLSIGSSLIGCATEGGAADESSTGGVMGCAERRERGTLWSERGAQRRDEPRPRSQEVSFPREERLTRQQTHNPSPERLTQRPLCTFYQQPSTS